MKKDMTQGKIWQPILLFTLPIMAGNLLQQLYNAADGVIVGNFAEEGSYALSAVGTCASMTMFFLALAIGLSVGGGIIISQFFGAKKYDDMQRAASTVLFLLGGVGILVSILGISFSHLILENILSVTPEYGILDMAITYFRIFCLGLFFQFVYNAIAAMLRNVGDSRATLYFLLISSVLNIGLDLLFVAGFRWGVAGAGWATVIAQIVCAFVSFIYMYRRHPELRPNRRKKLFDRKLCALTLKLGLPTAAQQALVSMGHMAMQRLVNSFDVIRVAEGLEPASMAAYTAALRIEQFAMIPSIAFNNGTATFVGQNIGARQVDRARKGMKQTQVVAVIVCVVISTLIVGFARPISQFFSLEGEALMRCVEQVRYVTPFFIIFAVNQCFAGFLQGAGDVFYPMIGSLSSLATRAITGYSGNYLGIFGYNAPWITMPLGWFFYLLITMSRYLSGRWKKKALVSQGPDNQDPDHISETDVEPL